MYSVREILIQANIRHEVFWSSGEKTVFLSEANQLFATKKTFDEGFPKADKGYEGWEAHHILEYQDCIRLGLEQKLPGYEDQICVLIPPGGHRGRINAILRRLLPTGSKVNVGELKSTYSLTYSMLGNYCGSTEDAIRFELMQILRVLVA